MEIIGYIGLGFLAASWVPQTIQTIKEKKCNANSMFLFLAFCGSLSLMIYAMMLGNTVFSLLNLMTSSGAFINLYYKYKVYKTVRV
jgi:MtN3 and saliva related transmembrane protein